MRVRVVIGLLLTAVAVAAVAVLFWNRVQEPETVADGRLRVVTTFVPLYSLTVAVAGDDALVENLLPPGVGPHDYAFIPSDVERLARADVLVANGLGLETWLDDAVRAANPDITVVEAAAGVATRAPDEHGPVDPHVWLDPVRAKTMVENISLALSTADPEHMAAYGARAKALAARLDALDAEIRAGLADVNDRRFIAFHDAFGYFAERYDLETVAVIEPSPGVEPSPRDVARIIDLIRTSKVKAIFTEPQFSPRLVETIAAETGLTTHALDPMETGPFSADAYFDISRANLAELRAAFGIRP